MPENRQFIQQRLDSLNQIDTNIVGLLANMSEIFDSYSSPNNNSGPGKKVIEDKTRVIYQTLSDIAINLRKEVKIMDDNIGVFDKNDENVMILPIPVQQKNTQLGERRIKEEIAQLNKLIPAEPRDDQKFIPKVKQEKGSTRMTQGKEAEERPKEEIKKEPTKEIEKEEEDKKEVQENKEEEETEIKKEQETNNAPISDIEMADPVDIKPPESVEEIDDDDFEMFG